MCGSSRQAKPLARPTVSWFRRRRSRKLPPKEEEEDPKPNLYSRAPESRRKANTAAAAGARRSCCIRSKGGGGIRTEWNLWVWKTLSLGGRGGGGCGPISWSSLEKSVHEKTAAAPNAPMRQGRRAHECIHAWRHRRRCRFPRRKCRRLQRIRHRRERRRRRRREISVGSARRSALHQREIALLPSH